MNAGIRIRAYPTAATQYKALKAAAQQQNYWAQVAVNTIDQLCSGYLKESVYVTSTPFSSGRIQFNVMMPGCVAEVIQRANGEFLLCTITADTQYLEKQQAEKKPGYYEITEGQDGVVVSKYIDSGRVTKAMHPIAITDQYRTPRDAANAALPYVKKAPNISTLGGVGMFFTPGEQPIGGYKNIHQAQNSATDSSLREAALLLMRLMKDARDLEGISWISERGGSGILTQAMYLLASQKATFNKEKNHQAFFSAPTTDIEVAERLALDLRLRFDRKSRYFDPLNINQLVGSGRIGGSTLVSAWERYRKDENHTLLKFGVDVASELGAGKTLVDKTKAVTQGVSLAAGAAAATSGSPLIALGLVLAGTAPTVFKSFFPDKYHKLADKF